MACKIMSTPPYLAVAATTFPKALFQNATSSTKNKVYMFGGLTTSQSCSSPIVGATVLGVAQGSTSTRDCTQAETFRWMPCLFQEAALMSPYRLAWVQYCFVSALDIFFLSFPEYTIDVGAPSGVFSLFFKFVSIL